MRTHPDMSSHKAREYFGRQYGMKANPAAIRLIMPATDTITVYPSDPSHSDGLGLGLLLHNLFCDEVLTNKVVHQYAEVSKQLHMSPDLVTYEFDS